jgi:penicillin-binding protein 2
MLIFDQLRKNDPQLRVITWGVLLGMGALFVGLWYVQVISHRHYAENQKAQSFRTVRIPGIRGKILDRNGVPLAENQPSYNVSLYLDELRDQFKEEWLRSRPKAKLTRGQSFSLEAQARYRVVNKVVQHLGAGLDEPMALDYGQFLKHYTNQLALPLLVLTNLAAPQIARFQEQSASAPGLDLEVQPLRVYPYRTTAAHVIGFLVHDNSSAMDEDAFFNFRLPDYRGVVGIEGTFDQELRGKAGMKSVLVNSLGYRQSEYVWTPAEPGRNVILTIDLAIQKAAENAMGNLKGAAVVMDPNNGDLLALVSNPAYNPNIYIPRLTPEEARKLNDYELRPQINRATQENYRPGSIFKIAVALACLEAGLNPDEKIFNPSNPAEPGKGHIVIGRRSIKDTAPAGEYNFRRAFIRSSNTYFITNGLRYGVQNIVRIGQRLHLGEATGLPTRQEVRGNFPSPQDLKRGWSMGDSANLCFGQGKIDVTPLQMTVMVAAIANGGKVLWPRLVERVEPQGPVMDEEEVVSFPPKPPRDYLGVHPLTLQIIRDAMLADVEDNVEGTGKAAFIEGFRICSKTGTAQVKDMEGTTVDYTTWFASYAPFGSPRYVVLVMTEGLGHSGGGTCAPIARKIYEAILKQEAKPTKPALLTEAR